jgi:RNA polymerase sigma factor, sigma-70 family
LAEEVLHEAYIKIWNKAGEFQPQKGSPLGWMATIARNSALDLLRKQRRELLAPEEPAPETTSSKDPDALELLSRSEDGKALQHCLGELPEEQRESILLAFWRGFSHQELSAQLNKPLGIVKSWVRRGLERLKRCLES